MTKRIFLIAGEPSGDQIGARLMAALKTASPEPIEFSGIGGPLMEAEGFKSLIDMKELTVMGLWEVIGHLPRMMSLIKGAVRDIEKFDPDVLITIDYPDFNFEVASRVRKNGKIKAKLVHYVAPTVWAWRQQRAEWVAQFLDGMICLFPFEPPYFTKHRLRTEFVGHPLVETCPPVVHPAGFRRVHKIPESQKTLGLFFGSRQSEIKKFGPVLRETAEILLEQDPDLHFILPTLPHLEYDVLKTIDGMNCSAYVVKDIEKKWDAFAACDAGLAVSGTVALELAYAGVPHIITYKMHPVSWAFVKMVVKVKYAHLANLLLDEPVVPEFLQGKCNPLLMGKELLKIYKVEGYAQKQKDKLAKLRDLLNPGMEKTPSARAAEFVLSFLN